MEKQGIKITTMPYFYELWLPRSISVIFVILFLLSIFSGSFILTNAVSVMFLVHVVCGISVVDYFMRGKGVNGALRALVLVLLIIISSVVGGLCSSILCCMGMSDSLRRIRK